MGGGPSMGTYRYSARQGWTTVWERTDDVGGCKLRCRCNELGMQIYYASGGDLRQGNGAECLRVARMCRGVRRGIDNSRCGRMVWVSIAWMSRVQPDARGTSDESETRHDV